jgi:hypothetical protein
MLIGTNKILSCHRVELRTRAEFYCNYIFTIYVIMLLIAKATYHQMTGRSLFKVPFWRVPGSTAEIHLGRDLKPRTSEYEIGMLSTKPQGSVRFSLLLLQTMMKLFK